MDFDVLIHKLAEDNSWSLLYMQEEDCYKLQLETPGDRHQDVYVNFRRDESGSWVASIWSVIAAVADFNLSDPVELLRFNWRHIYGCLAIAEDEVVLLQNQLCDDANWNEVAKAVRNIGFDADSIEEQIYGDVDEN